MEGRNRSGQGRKPVMDCSNKDVVCHAIKQNRQSVSKTRAPWEQALGKEANSSTFEHVLSTLAQDISE
ncbi:MULTISPECIES: hypothetical protein [Prevotellaceae]|uniref:hypothetical protein n=1 Tax=Prevotellaceae TaxID=171552 RepID=UPI000400532A|nr:hypothetical protein [Prevotella phocaeensis]